jgi:hypothetical protein
MNQGIITNLLTGLAVLVALIFLNRATRKAIAPDAAGRYHLRMNKLYSLAGITGLLMGLGLAIATIFREGTMNIDKATLIVMILGIFWGFGIPCLLYYRNHRVIFDDTTIAVVNVFRKSKTVAWEEITVARVRPLTGMLVIYTPAATVKVHQHFVGISNLINKFTEKKGWTAQDMGIRW